jgi:DNA-binding NtrC family response regulator
VQYDWPGNVRELSNVIERAIILSGNNLITIHEIPPLDTLHTANRPDTSPSLSLDEVEKRHIQLVLDAEGGNKTQAARILGVSRPKLYRKMKKYGIADPHPLPVRHR